MKMTVRKLFQSRYAPVAAIVLVIIAFAAGRLSRRGAPPEHAHEGVTQPAQEQARVQVWTCSMHPQIRLPKPGKCPICGMTLIPVTSGEAGGEAVGPRELKLSAAAAKLADIQVAPVERKSVSAEVRMVGKLDYDETRLGYITAWVPGRLDRLYVDYTGVTVRKGDHMVYIYSPELLTAQEELLQALKTVKELGRSGSSIMKRTAQQTVEAVREKLRLWGLADEQVAEIEKRGKPSEHMTINAPMSGIVIHKNVLEGMYVNTGTRIYTIANLTQVWAKLDAYESDIGWLKHGQEVEIETEAYPGEVFTGKIAFIDPVLEARTRTIKVRVNIPNDDGRLKPDMFVHAVVHADVAAGGKVIAPDLAGKWMCPMHPEIVKDGPGACDICEMPLATTESLGYVSAEAVAGTEAPLVIPASAPLITGKRAIVYVQVPDKDGTFEGREIALGPRAGDYYLVKEGLKEGELVVVNGNFKIDSALQILAKPSMMSPEGGAPPPGHRHGEGRPHTPAAAAAEKRADVPLAFQQQLHQVYGAYLKVHKALANDSKDAAAEAVTAVRQALDSVDMTLLSGDAHMSWMKHQKNVAKILSDMESAEEIEAIRAGFAPLSEELATVIRAFGIGTDEPVYILKCPMAFNNRGANWLQETPATRNPYFGATMPKCGSIVDTITNPESEHPGEHGHE